VSVTLTGPAGLKKKRTLTLKLNTSPAFTELGPVLKASKHSCRTQQTGALG
jgi:hypothetical protein